MYPYPADVTEFENAYVNDHIPLAMEKIKGMSKFVATRILSTPDGGKAPFYRIAELHFPSMEALSESAGSAGAQEAINHAVSISTGGPPIFMVAEEETTEF